MAVDPQEHARQYERWHNLLFVGETVYTLVLLGLFLVSGLSVALASWAQSLSANPWGATAIYGVVLVLASKLLYLPLNWLGGFWLEHRYGLANQRLGGWLLDEAKSLGLSLVLGVLVLEVIYFLLRVAGAWWWLAAAGFFLLFGVVLSTLFPVLILPLFYKLQPLEDEALRQRLTGLARRAGAEVIGVFRMGLGAKTKKANAAFAGLGRTKRIILGDTLLENFAADEIEVVMAHEMAHYRNGDITKLMAWSALTTLVGLKIADWVLDWGLARAGFAAASDLGAFPLLALSLFLFGLLVMPLNNGFSRWREWKADAGALALTNNPDGFVRAMHKLAEQNLADLHPPAWIEYLLHDHPALGRRIKFAKQWKNT